MPSAVADATADSYGSIAFPELGSGALASLTSKIQANLQTAKSLKQKKKSKGEGKAAPNSNENSDRQHSNAVTFSQESQKRSGASESNVRHGHGIPESQGQGTSKKRLRDGKIKDDSSLQKPRSDRKIWQKSKQPAQDFDIRSEIKTLGGEDEDYDLIAGVSSESEIEGPQGKSVAGDLLKDLKSFAGGLDFQQLREDDASSDDVSLDSQRVQEDDEASALGDRDVKKDKQNGRVGDEKLSNRDSRPNTTLNIEPLSEWHAVELPALPSATTEQKAVSMELIDRIQAHAKKLLEEENQAYATTQSSASSSRQFYTEVMFSGTLSDKIGALTLSIQESPLHNMKAMENLLSLGRKRSRAQAVDVLGALKDLFGPGSLLPTERKLLTFAGQAQLHALFASKPKWKQGDALPKPLRKAHLIFWAFEDWLKSQFFEMLRILETWCNDEVVFARGRAVDYVFALLKEKPEQEANLLRLLVNKLGDTDKKIASKASYHILQLQTTHPAMKPAIISSIEADLLFRPGQSLHAQYYAIITLNQTVLSNREVDVAKKLISTYFSMFLRLLAKPKDEPSVKDDEPKATPVKLNRKGEVQGGGSTPGRAALRKKANSEKSKAVESELRDKIVAAVLTGVNRAIPYITTDDEDFEKHLDTLFRVTHSSNFNTSIQALMLIQQIQGSSQISADRFYRTLYESLLDPRLLTSSKQVLYLNLLYRSLRADLNVDRIKAFVKRIAQIVTLHQPSFACGALYLIREMETTFPGLASFISKKEEDDSDGEEHFQDVQEGEANTNPSALKAGHTRQYDPHKRDPLHSNAQLSTLWEVHPLMLHYHPSVSLFASRLSTHDEMPPKPDLNLNTLIHFLDKFVYKSPKTSVTKQDTLKGHSLMQPFASNDKSGAVLVSKSGAADKVPVNAEEFWKKEAGSIGADDVFFHRYFSEVGKRKEKRASKKENKKKEKGLDGLEADVDGDEDESEDEDEEEIWKALVGSRSEVAGEGAADEGIDVEELEGYSDEDDDDDDVDIEGGDDDEDAVAEAEDMGDDDFPDFLEDEADDDLVDSEDDLPAGMDLDQPIEGASAGKSGSGKGGKQDERRGKKKQRLKNLPTFASVDDFEKLMGGDEEEGVA